MKLNSSNILFINTMSLGILMSVSSNNWIMIWCGLEVSLVSFIPLMINKMMISSESMMKYFIVQSISSAMLMLGVLIMIMKGDYNYDYLLLASLMMKMGVAPFHNWVLTVLEGLDLMLIMVMLTINKIAPLTLMSYLNQSYNMIIMITMILGAIMGLNQNSMKKIIGYSSIFNMGLILTLMKNSLMWMLYLMVYSFLILFMISLMKINKMNFVNQMVFSEMNINKLTLWINLLSMGGMPPLIGFSIKYMAMVYMIDLKLMLIMITMIMSSLLVMFFYMRMSFVSIMSYSVTNKTKLFYMNEMSSWFLMINLTLLPMLMLMKTYMV
uniref:NADH-ubiquinone oxidoreductase chain 2 n=1 Tax=Parafagocyba longa TaxID=2893149 RepID=A0A9E7BY51_9HEMI|nr:NADH dehydrogenase subunit 2 [Parafagocyba longa]UGN61342.1 NADH dehydrogenase subunit 2 [Parafagocyba longa]